MYHIINAVIFFFISTAPVYAVDLTSYSPKELDAMLVICKRHEIVPTNCVTSGFAGSVDTRISENQCSAILNYQTEYENCNDIVAEIERRNNIPPVPISHNDDDDAWLKGMLK